MYFINFFDTSNSVGDEAPKVQNKNPFKYHCFNFEDFQPLNRSANRKIPRLKKYFKKVSAIFNYKQNFPVNILFYK